MKNITSIITSLFILLLASCGSNLPAKSSLDEGMGILAIPKSYTSEVSWEDGWKTDLQITDANGKALDEVVRLHNINGRQFLFVSDLSAGKYTVSGYRRVGAGENAMGGPSEFYSLKGLGKATTVNIVEGEVTVLPLIFKVEHKSNGYNRSSSFLKIRPLIGEELEKFTMVMEEANKNDEWPVNWLK